MWLGSPSSQARRRLTRSAVVLGIAVALLAGTGASASASASASTTAILKPPTQTPVVAILLAPYLTFSDLSPDTTPRLWSLAEDGALGSMNAVTADQGWPTVTGGALSLSAGRWATAGESIPAQAASMDAFQRANDDSLAVPRLGALGDAVHAAGGRTAAVGSGDAADSTGRGIQRQAELVAGDSRGRIDIIDTGAGLLTADSGSPQGTRTDSARLYEAISSAIDGLMGAPGPRLLVVDSGDLTRAHARAATPEASATDAARDHGIALATLDAAAGDLQAALPPGSLLLVVAPATDKPYYEPPRLAPAIAWGTGITGVMTSPSTHRPGLITNHDIGPTVLAALGVEQPPTMIGRPLFTQSSAVPLAEQIEALGRVDTAVGSIDKLRDLFFTPAFVWFAVAVTLLAAAVGWFALSRLRFLAEALVLLVLSAPSAAWLMWLLAPSPSSVTGAAAAFAIALLVVFSAACAMWWRRRISIDVPMLFLSGLTVVVICADQWLGDPRLTGLFSYSIRAGWRYYGMGNEGSALLVGAALVALGLSIDLLGTSRHAHRLRRFGAPALGGIVLMTAAAPFAGANAGVALWGIIAFGVAWVGINDVRFTPKSIAGIAAIMVGLVGLLVAIDLLGAGTSQTHLGRYFVSMGNGDAWELVVRKAANNLGYISQTPYTWLALALGGALALLRFAPPRPLASALEEHPGYRGALLGVVIGGVAAFLTEDSGIVMPALMLLAGGLPVLALAFPAPRATKRNRG